MGVETPLSGKTFLITGATGRLGVEISSRLEELGAVIIPLITPGYPEIPARIKWSAKSPPVKFEEIDPEKINPDYVINLHWRVKRDLNYTGQILFEIDYNIHKLLQLWDILKLKSVRNFINVSSIKVFSELNSLVVSADEEPKPNSPYGITKYTAEKFFDSFFNLFFPVIHLRLSSVASFGEHPSQLMSRLFSSAYTGEQIKINCGHLSRLFYIDEAVDLIISAAISEIKNKYIISPKGISNKLISEIFEQISGRELNAEYLNQHTEMNDQVFIPDIEQIAKNWVRSYSIQETIQKIITLNKNNSFQLA